VLMLSITSCRPNTSLQGKKPKTGGLGLQSYPQGTRTAVFGPFQRLPSFVLDTIP
jgi:hypothetical protein